MAKKKAKPAAMGETVYKLKVTLRDFRPAIWRRIETRDCSLGELYPVLLAAMGWDDSHLHCYRAGRVTYGPPDLDLDFEGGDEDEDEVRLSDLVKHKVKRLVFEYDFGDGWEHDLLFEKPTTVQEGVRYPRVTAGAMACPPEDCGGVWGYACLLDILGDPKHKEYEERLEWVGGKIDPEAFDLEAINAGLPRQE